MAYQYDIVCNGIELSSGAIRNHIPELMYKLFSIAGYDKKQVNEKFSGMINALSYGAPPHGGIAPGIDRIVMLLANEKNIREVTMFPMNQNAQDLMMNAPSEINESQLKELNLFSKNKKIIYFLPLRFILTSDKSTRFFFIVISNKSFTCYIFYYF